MKRNGEIFEVGNCGTRWVGDETDPYKKMVKIALRLGWLVRHQPVGKIF